MKREDPIRYNWNYLKSNAKRRGKDFSLTLEEFRDFCAETGYDKLKGKTINSASIDRIDNTRGYHIDNIRVVSLSLNSQKGDALDCPF